MSAFVTGGTGFIGKRLVRRLLERDGEPVYVLVYQPRAELVAALNEFWGAGAERVALIEGDISKPDLGVSAKDARKLKGKIDHFFHLAAVYDLNAPPAQVVTANVAGVANALSFAKAVKAACFHHVSSIAAAGLYDGAFREDMFEEARGLEHPYYASKHKGEGLVWADKEIAWRIYRITVPAFEDYAWRLWDYWERRLDPALFVDRSLRGAVAGKRVLVTGGSAGIGKAIALWLAQADAKTLIVARDEEKLDLTREEFSAQGLEVETYSADISDSAQCAAFIRRILSEHGGIDILVNNAGRSIRRAVENSYDRLYDNERLMRLNYLAAVQLAMGFLPGMAERRSGHIVNISSIGALTTAPRFSAYVASKAALEAWSDCVASEFLDRNVAFTNVNMPLVRTEMIAPTRFYEHVPTLDPDEAAGLVVEAIIHRPARMATRLGRFGQAVHALAPNMGRIVLNTAFRMFPESAAASGAKEGDAAPTADQIAFTQLLRGLHI